MIGTSGTNKMSAGVIRGGPSLAGIEISVLVSESHNKSAQVSTFALESGASVADHITQNPDELTVNFEMANTGGGTMAARDVLESFTRMKEEGQLLEITTEHALYRDMAIIAIGPVHEAPFKGALRFSLTLQAVRRAQLNVVGRQPVNLEGRSQKNQSAEIDAGQQDPEYNKTRLQEMLNTSERLAKEGV